MGAIRWRGPLAVALVLGLGSPLLAQTEEEVAHLSVLPLLRPGGTLTYPIRTDTAVSFIDHALPLSMVRLRYDSSFNSNRPARAEFLMAAGGPGEPGLPKQERRIDWQEASLYVEWAFLPSMSMFIDAPVRWLNPELNDNHAGVGDVAWGVKLALYQAEDLTASVTLRAVAPTGKPQSGLGTGHAVLQPGLAINWQPIGPLLVEGVLDCWIPVDDSRFGSEVIHYGLGVSLANRSEEFWFTPVAEAAGWSCTRGRAAIVFPSGQSSVVEAQADTIINGFLGLRAGYGSTMDAYIGYGRALSGEVWYKETWRAEVRWRY